MFPDVGVQKRLISYYQTTTNHSANMVLAYIKLNRRVVDMHLGRSTLKEMMLNYRTLYTPKKKNKILLDFKTYIMTKEIHHTSDLAIGFNIVSNVTLTVEEEEYIIDFMFNRLQSTLVNANLLKVEHVYFLKKQLVMDYIVKHIITRKTTT
jgi:hypothetical protein